MATVMAEVGASALVLAETSARSTSADGDAAEPAPAVSSTAVSSTAVSSTAVPTTPAPSDQAPSTTTGGFGFLPEPAPAAELGPPEARLLPDPASGYRVESVSQQSPVAPPTEQPRVQEGGLEPSVEQAAFPATNPADRRAIIAAHSRYTTEADADRAFEAAGHRLQTPDLIDAGSTTIGGRPAHYTIMSAAPPMAGGAPRHELLTTIVRLDATSILTISLADGTIDQVAVIVESAGVDGDAIVYGAQPAGFDPAVARSGPTIWQLADETRSDILGLVVSNELTGARVGIEIVADPASLDAHPIDPSSAAEVRGNGRGYVRYGLFRERSLLWIIDEHVVQLDDYSFVLSDEELVDLAAALTPADEETWSARLDGLTGYRSAAVPLD